MKNTEFPTITTVVQAEPWEEGHVAPVSSPRSARCFCKWLISSILPPPTRGADYEVVSNYKSAVYNILPNETHVSRGGIFCALLLGLMMGFSACSKPETTTSDPKQGGGAAPNQGVSINIDTTWLPETIIDFTPNP